MGDNTNDRTTTGIIDTLMQAAFPEEDGQPTSLRAVCLARRILQLLHETSVQVSLPHAVLGALGMGCAVAQLYKQPESGIA